MVRFAWGQASRNWSGRSDVRWGLALKHGKRNRLCWRRIYPSDRIGSCVESCFTDDIARCVEITLIRVFMVTEMLPRSLRIELANDRRCNSFATKRAMSD